MSGQAQPAQPIRPALSAPPLTPQAAERIRALLGIGLKQGHPIGIHPRPRGAEA